MSSRGVLASLRQRVFQRQSTSTLPNGSTEGPSASSPSERGDGVNTWIGALGSNMRGEKSFGRERPTLVDAGENAGHSRVIYRGHNLPLHLLTNDFFITVINMQTRYVLLIVAAVYLVLFFLWSVIWWLIVKYYDGCLYGAESYVEALVFSVVTQMTIGYGNTHPESCWVATWLIIIQSIAAVILEAVVIGVVFARISHPAQRARSIFMSNKAVMSRRDGILKFMFRVADVRNTQVVEPKVKAYLYTWGDGRVTAEGERIPVRVEPLQVDYIDGQLLLPLIIEHTVDERSPLCGHSHSSLTSLSAEIIVTFEGTTEAGNPFMARRSYTPEDIWWGHQFQNIITKPNIDDEHGHFEVALDLFNKVERQQELPQGHPSHLSNLVVGRAKRTVPYPLLGENTLVLSDVLCVSPDEQGRLCLFCRVGDTYPSQTVELEARIVLFRWKDKDNVSKLEESSRPAPCGEPYEQIFLECGYETGVDRLYLRLPSLLRHVIDEDSPLAPWLEEGGMDKDICSEICVVINGYMNYDNSNVLRQRTYAVDHHVKYGYGFVPIIRHPGLARDRKPRIRWQHFHDVSPAQGMDDFPPPPAFSMKPGAGGLTAAGAGGLTVAPESHGNMRSIAMRQGKTQIGEYSGITPGVSASEASDMVSQLPSTKRPTLAELRNDFTIVPSDLQRYAAAVGGDASAVTGCLSGSFRVASSMKGSFRDGGADTGEPSEAPLLFPNVHLQYQLDDTMDADTSLPHAAALHPALPGPDRFRVQDETDYTLRNDFTVTATDVTRYQTSIGHQPNVALASQSPQQQQQQRTSTGSAGDDGTKASNAVFGDTIEARRSSSLGTEETQPSTPFRPSSTANEAATTTVRAGTPPARQASTAENVNEEDMGPLTGYHPIERTVSHLTTGGEEETEEAGPMHFSGPLRGRGGSKSLKEISSLFAPRDDDDDGDDNQDDNL